MRNNNNSLGVFVITTAVCCLLIDLFYPLNVVHAFSAVPSLRHYNIRTPIVTSWKQQQQHNHYSCSSTQLYEHKYRPDGMPILPSNVVKYTTLPRLFGGFTSTTIPPGLLKSHTTKEGTWGVIRPYSGQVEYTIYEPKKSIHVLDEDNLGIIEPTMLHHVKALSEDVEFVVEFWRAPGSGVVDEKREGL